MTYGNTDILISLAMTKRTAKLFPVSVIDSSLSNFPQLLLRAKFSFGSYGLNDSIKKSQSSCQDFKTRHSCIIPLMPAFAKYLNLYIGAEVMVEIITKLKIQRIISKFQVTNWEQVLKGQV